MTYESYNIASMDVPVPGSGDLAKVIAEWHVNSDLCEHLPDQFRHLGTGEHRAAYLHEPTAVVYKIGYDEVNRYEHQTLAKLRADGHDHAPATSLHDVHVTDYTDCQWGLEPRERDVVVIAMPYLPEDGSVPHKGVWLPGMVDLNPSNIHANGGRLWLIDAGGL